MRSGQRPPLHHRYLLYPRSLPRHHCPKAVPPKLPASHSASESQHRQPVPLSFPSFRRPPSPPNLTAGARPPLPTHPLSPPNYHTPVTPQRPPPPPPRNPPPRLPLAASFPISIIPFSIFPGFILLGSAPISHPISIPGSSSTSPFHLYHFLLCAGLHLITSSAIRLFLNPLSTSLCWFLLDAPISPHTALPRYRPHTNKRPAPLFACPLRSQDKQRRPPLLRTFHPFHHAQSHNAAPAAYN